MIGYIGRLSPEKGQRELILAGVEIRKALPEVWFVFVGDGPDRIALEELAGSVGMADRVVFTGHMSDVRAVYRDLDLLALTSYTEGFPNVVLEALCMDVPVIATDVGGVNEIVEDGRTGLLVPPRDPAAIAKGAMRLLAHPDQAREMAAAGKQAVFDRFEFGQRVRREEALYEEVLREWAARPVEKRAEP